MIKTNSITLYSYYLNLFKLHICRKIVKIKSTGNVLILKNEFRFNNFSSILQILFLVLRLKNYKIKKNHL